MVVICKSWSGVIMVGMDWEFVVEVDKDGGVWTLCEKVGNV